MAPAMQMPLPSACQLFFISEEGRSNQKILSFRWNRNQKIKPICLVCLEPPSAMKYFNLCGHYNSLHKYKKYTEAARSVITANFFTTFLTQLQPHRRLHPRQMLLCSSLLKQRNLLVTLKKLDMVSLSHRMMTFRIFDIRNHVEREMKHLMHDCEYFSLDLEERKEVMISACW